MPDPLDSPMFSLLRGFSRVVVRGYHTVTPLNACPIPRVGPAIVAPNHTSSLDPLIVQSVVRRPIIWMMASEYMRVPCTAWLWRALRIIPVERNGRDASAFRAAVRVLRDGGVLGIFPEAKWETDNRLLPLHPGIAHIAHLAGAPVTPVWIDGTQRNQNAIEAIFFQNQARVIFGKPFLSSPDTLIFQLENKLKSLQQLSQSHI